MKKYLLASVLGLSLTSCEKVDQGTNFGPAPTAAPLDQALQQTVFPAFGWNFNLAFQQQAVFRSAGRTELTVTAADFAYSFCPSGAYCLIADYVNPTFNVKDAQGRLQVVSMTAPSPAKSANWIDTTSVRANGRRYLLQFNSWSVKAGTTPRTKADISVSVRVSKAVR